MSQSPHILWADDEIDLLKPHVLFLESKGYRVTSVANGADAVEKVGEGGLDVVLLDEQMPGMDGLETLKRIAQIAPELPVVMITKSEEERIMEEALGRRIRDYLTKPVNPSQVLLTCKRILDRERLRSEQISQDYLQSFNQISSRLLSPMSHDEWVELYLQLVRYDIGLEGDDSVRQILRDQFREANRVFGGWMEDRYADWIADEGGHESGERPVLSHEVVQTSVLPLLRADKTVVFVVIDCMRYDQWLMFESLLFPYYAVETSFHFSLLPSSTPYSRNAIFSGMLPREIARRYPKIWSDGEEDEHSRNRNEDQFLQDLLDRHNYSGRLRYAKLVGAQDGREVAQNVRDLTQVDLSALVVNFVDVLAHSRSDSDVLKEIAPDERAYRALTRTWFEHSWLFEALRDLSSEDCTVVITTDHGAVRSLRAAKVIGDRHTSTALRYKYGRNLKCDDRHAIFVRQPEQYGLPSQGINSNFIIAKEDYYFVYPTNYNFYLNKYRDTMQHGGASMEEIILPVVTLTPR